MRPTINSRRALYLTSAAALGSSLSSTTCSHAFAPPVLIPRHCHQFNVITTTPQSRLYSSKNSNDGGILGALTKVAKKILPKSWTQSDEEKQIELRRKEVQSEISGGIDQMLRDAPLPIKMMGKMMGPLVSSAFSGLAAEMGQQQRQLQDFLNDAQNFIVADPSARQALGEPIRVQQPFSQSSSTTSINGKSTSNIQASFYVSGSVAQGVAQMIANQDGISRLVLEVNGRQIQVSLVKKMWSKDSNDFFIKSESIGKNRINRDDVIDVEFVEKDKSTK